MSHLSHTYHVVPEWGRDLAAPALGLVSTVATDSQGNVYVLSRLPEAAMRVFDRDGRFLRTWSSHTFVEPHGLWIGPDDRVYVTDVGDHTVRILTLAGTLTQTIGTPGRPGASGAPFNGPTRAVPGPSGAIYVTDGYGQNRIHKFAPDGRLLHSWGESGDGSGQVETPHSLWVDRQERIYVVDRGNGRIQIFDSEGMVISIWTGFCFPHDVFITEDGVALVTDCAPRSSNSAEPYFKTMPAQPISEWTTDGAVIRRWGATGPEPGQFLDCPHSLWMDVYGDIYVSEVITPNRLQKFRKTGVAGAR